MNQSPLQYVRKSIGAAIDADAEIVVQYVHKDAWRAGKCIAYPYISQAELGTIGENGQRGGYSRASFEILCNVQTDADPTGKGIASDVVDEFVSRMMYRLHGTDWTALEAADDGRYVTRIYGVTIDGVTSDYADNDTKVLFGIAGTAIFGITLSS